MKRIRIFTGTSIAVALPIAALTLVMWLLLPALPARGDLGTNIIWVGMESSDTSSVAWGDWDGDGDLDIAVGNSWGVNQVYKNDGTDGFSLAWQSSGEDYGTNSVAWGEGTSYDDLIGNHPV